jgi:pimeloyl-ACP methyl ester carboxylesterase
MSAAQLIFAFVAIVIAALYAFTQFQARRIAALHPPRGAFVDMGGGYLHVSEARAIGPVRAHVVLIHGASGSEADMMAPLGAKLAARGFHVLAIDRPGHGWSDRLDGETPARQAALMRAALAKGGVERAIIVAHSLGGIVGTNLALDHKDFVAGLVLAAPVTHPWPGGTVSWYYTVATTPFFGHVFTHLLAMPARLALLDRTLAAVFAPQSPPTGYADRTGLARVLRPENFAANARDVAGAYDVVAKQAPRLKEIIAPTAIVTGDTDGIVLTRVHSYGSERDIPGATLKLLPGVGHSPHWVAPEAIVDAVEAVARRAGR